jgi:DNA-binding transcriptional MerR regulator
MSATYTTKQASELTGASKQAIRVYTQRYARYMSTEATPDAGSERRFTEADLKLMAYIYQQTQRGGQTHDKVLEALASGALDAFEWEPRTSPQEGYIDAETTGTALVPIERLMATQALLQAQLEERQRLLERERELLDQVQRLQREVGKAEGKIESLEEQLKQPMQRPRSWWARLLGGGE